MADVQYLYKNNEIGVKPLDELELQGNYPNWFSDLEVCRFNRHSVYPMRFREVEHFVGGLAADRSQIVWAVYALDNNLHIGNVSLQHINLLDRTADIAFIFGEKSHWGKGYGFSAAKLLIEHGFSKLNLNRIACGTAAENSAMRKLALKLGMRQEGCRRQGIFLNGHYVDIIEYGLLASECIA